MEASSSFLKPQFFFIHSLKPFSTCKLCLRPIYPLNALSQAKSTRNEQGEVSLIFVFRFSLFVFRFSFFVFRSSFFAFRFSLFVFRYSLFVFRFSFFVFHFCHFAMREIRYDAISNPILLITNRENMLFLTLENLF